MGALIAEEVRCTAAIKAFVREIDAAMEKAIRLELMFACCCYGCGALNGCVTLASTLLFVLLKVQPKYASLLRDGVQPGRV